MLNEEFDITILFYNPNITEQGEYEKRVAELERFVHEAPFAIGVKIIDGGYAPKLFFDMAKGLEHLSEKGARCFKCYEMRMRETACFAKNNNYDIFTTSLSISPHKNATWINEIGNNLSKEIGIDYLYSDFKKKNGYARSIQLSKEYGLYRQDYCGCIFSKNESEKRRNKTL